MKRRELDKLGKHYRASLATTARQCRDEWLWNLKARGLTAEEIAAVVGILSSSVRNRLVLMRKQFRARKPKGKGAQRGKPDA